MVDLELYEIVHERNPLRETCVMMVDGRMQVPWYYTGVTLYFARHTGSLFFSLNADCIVQLDDMSTRWWLPLRQDESYNSMILQKIAHSERQYSIHGPSSLPLSKMLYDVILHKVLYDDSITENKSWRESLEPLMLKYLTRHTIDQDAQWVDHIIEDGWTQTEGVFSVP